MAKKTDDGSIFEQMQFDYGVAATAVEDTTAALTKAMEVAKTSANNRREDFVTEGVTELNQAIDLVPDAVQKLAVARGSAKTAAYHMPSVKDHKDEIVAAINQIAKWEKQLLKLDTAAKKQVEANFAVQDKLWQGSKEYGEVVKQMTKILAEVLPDLESMRAAVDSSYAKAAKSVEMRNADGLSLAQDDIAKLNIKKFEDAAGKLDGLKKKAMDLNQKASQEARMELMTEFGHARARTEKLDKEVEHFKERKQAVKSMKVAPIEIVKAMKILSLPPAQKTALTKALGCDETRCTKALDEIAKQAKLSQSGKDMFAALRKAKIV